jgi:hypothetical protein
MVLVCLPQQRGAHEITDRVTMNNVSATVISFSLWRMAVVFRYLMLAYFTLIFLSLSLFSADNQDANQQFSRPVMIFTENHLAWEAEIEQPPKEWSVEKDVPDYQGRGYLRWTAGNSYRGLGSGEIRYRIVITEAGRYQVRLRCNTKGAEKSDLGNDVFTRFNQGPWVKTFLGGGSVDGWLSRVRLEPKGGTFADSAYNLGVGLHTFCMSGRSHGMRVDRIIMWKDGTKQPSDTVPAQPNAPTPPETLSDEAVLSVWRQGGFGAVMAWAMKQKDKPESQHVVTVLSEYADQQVAIYRTHKERDPLLGLTLLEILASQYQGSSKGKELVKLLKEWNSEPAVVMERKASTMGDVIAELLRKYESEAEATKKTEIANNVRDGLKLLSAKYAETATYKNLLAQATAAKLVQ